MLRNNVWIYNTNIGHSKKTTTNACRYILHVAKSNENIWNKDEVAIPYKNPNDKRIRKRIENGSKGSNPYNWVIYEDLVKNVSKDKKENFIGNNQIPEGLLEFFIKACSNKGDLICDIFAGTGSTYRVANELDRKYIGFELNPESCKIANQSV